MVKNLYENYIPNLYGYYSLVITNYFITITLIIIQ